MSKQTQKTVTQQKASPKGSTPNSRPSRARRELRSKSYEQGVQMLRPGAAKAIQRSTKRSPASATTENVHAAAARGVQGGGGQLPHLAAIQASFGNHDVAGISAHVGGAAKEASQSMGARAYATGNAVAFADAPDLHTAAHEAAHTVQQRGGVSLKGGVGTVGDSYEQHADAVANAVVAGRPAEGLLDTMSTSGAASPVQRLVQMEAGADVDLDLDSDIDTDTDTDIDTDTDTDTPEADLRECETEPAKSDELTELGESPTELAWPDRVAAAKTDAEKNELMTEALNTHQGLLPAEVSANVTLVAPGTIVDAGNKVTDSDHQARQSWGIYFDPNMPNRGLRVPMMKDASFFKGVFGHEWVEDLSVPGYIALGLGALSAKDSSLTANVVFHEGTHVKAALASNNEDVSMDWGNYDDDAIQALDDLKQDILAKGEENGSFILSGAREALTHSLDFSVFYGTMNFDSAADVNQPSMASLTVIALRCWSHIATSSLKGADVIRDKVAANITGVSSKTDLRAMLTMLQSRGTGPFAGDMLALI